MKFMLDTNICIYLIKLKPEKVLKHFQSHLVGDIDISFITPAELRYPEGQMSYLFFILFKGKLKKHLRRKSS